MRRWVWLALLLTIYVFPVQATFPDANPHIAWFEVEGPLDFLQRKCLPGWVWCVGTLDTANEFATFMDNVSRYFGEDWTYVRIGNGAVNTMESIWGTTHPAGGAAAKRIHELYPKVRFYVADRLELIALAPDQISYAQDGCAHGTLSHYHEVRPNYPDTLCNWPTVKMCSAGSTHPNYTCMADIDCPSGTCETKTATDFPQCIPTIPKTGNLQPGDPGYEWTSADYNSFAEVRSTITNLTIQINSSAICDGEASDQAVDCAGDPRALCNGIIDCTTRRVGYYASYANLKGETPSFFKISGIAWDLRPDVCQSYKLATLLMQPYYAGLPTTAEILFMLENKAGQDLWIDSKWDANDTRGCAGDAPNTSRWGTFFPWATSSNPPCIDRGGSWLHPYRTYEWERASEGLYQKIKAQINDPTAWANRYAGHEWYGMLDVPPVLGLNVGGVTSSTERNGDPRWLGQRYSIFTETEGLPPAMVTTVGYHGGCDNGVDDDNDGFTDFAGGDPGCGDATSDTSESASHLRCDDGIDNDNDGEVDSDGGQLGAPPDTTCAGDPTAASE